MLLSFLRFCPALALLLLLGACQRATYSFRAPGALPAGPPAQPTPAAAWPAPQPLPAAAAPPAPTKLPRRPRATAAAKAARAASARPRLLRALAAAHTARRAAARQQPLPVGEPVRHRSRGIALLLALVPLLLGLPLGLHYFYLGYVGRGILTLALGVAAFVLIALGAIGALGLLFFGASSGALTLFVIGAIVLGILYLLQLIDAVRIAIGDLKPKNGEYYPRFFQVRPAAEPAPPGR